MASYEEDFLVGKKISRRELYYFLMEDMYLVFQSFSLPRFFPFVIEFFFLAKTESLSLLRKFARIPSFPSSTPAVLEAVLRIDDTPNFLYHHLYVTPLYGTLYVSTLHGYDCKTLYHQTKDCRFLLLLARILVDLDVQNSTCPFNEPPLQKPSS
jgi:hypothetical protein